MLFPGCRIKVIDSNVIGTTGPIPGSMGFVSNFYGHPTYIDFHRIVWYRYGKSGKERIETGKFTAVLSDDAQHAAFGKRRVGRIEVLGSKEWASMSKTEFLCWAYSILRLPKSIELTNSMRDELSQMFGINYQKAGLGVANLFHCDADFDAFGQRYMMFKYCRKARERYYMNRINLMRHEVKSLGKWILADCMAMLKKHKVELTPQSFAKAVADKTPPLPNLYRYTNFYSHFSHDAILFSHADKVCEADEWVAEIVKKLKETGGKK